MRKEKVLTSLLRKLVDLLSEESDRNPEFAAKLEAILVPLPERKARRNQRTRTAKTETLPDVHAELASRGESEFTMWLRGQPIAILRSVIRQHDLDASRRTTKWKEPEKLAAFITEQIKGRLARGSAFLTTREDPNKTE
jgi:hypothetical protein